MQHNTTRLTGLATQTKNKPLASFKGRRALLLWIKKKKSDYRSHTISKRNKRVSRLRGWKNKLARLLPEVAWRQMRLNIAIKEVCQSKDRHPEPQSSHSSTLTLFKVARRQRVSGSCSATHVHRWCVTALHRQQSKVKYMEELANDQWN